MIPNNIIYIRALYNPEQNICMQKLTLTEFSREPTNISHKASSGSPAWQREVEWDFTSFFISGLVVCCVTLGILPKQVLAGWNKTY